ncbi:hairy-related 11 isoform X2 [Onychostoma macrolepis]|uniref:hairy-related 11 isoform X2 n=1 Tax=Onychostoma macrolepis TaxID=369639 RepID=UPI00272B8F57|nr:hairy-related 11 isoform X2 [Onychostoma macrolepis]
MTKTEGVKRLKPVIEKKRRDRINHNLDALRDLLFKNTADTRLQNPKLEKAEILDLAVQYIKKTRRKTETKVTSTQMDSKATQKQSVSTGPIYASDFYERFKPSEQKEVLLKLGVDHNNPTGASKAGNEPVAQMGVLLSSSGQNYQQKPLLNPESSLDGSKHLHQSTSPPSSSSSSQCSSPPSSPTFTSLSSSPSNSPPYLFMPCPLPAPSDSLSPLSTPLSLHRPVIVPQPILPNMARDFTPPQSPVLALRPEPFSLPTQSIWRPWS